MIAIALFLFLIAFIVGLKGLSVVAGKLGGKFYGEKGRTFGRKVPWILLKVYLAFSLLECTYVQSRVSYICKKDAGLTVYVTPEQWREQNKSQWEALTQYDHQHAHALANGMEKINIDGYSYKVDRVENNRLVTASQCETIHIGVASKCTDILVDTQNNQVLMKFVEVSIHKPRSMINNPSVDSFRLARGASGCNEEWYRYARLIHDYSNQSLTQ